MLEFWLPTKGFLSLLFWLLQVPGRNWLEVNIHLKKLWGGRESKETEQLGAEISALECTQKDWYSYKLLLCKASENLKNQKAQAYQKGEEMPY